MLYFDTDVIIHSIIFQDEEKHRIAEQKIKNAIENEEFFISTITYQEIAFVLAKLKFTKQLIKKNLSFFLQFTILSYGKP